MFDSIFHDAAVLTTGREAITEGIPASARLFKTTCWEVVEEAGVGSESALDALRSILEQYRRPLLVHLESRYRLSVSEAEDYLHDFICQKVMLKKLLASANRARGRFRTFLLTALDRFVANSFRNAAAQKRRPDAGFTNLDAVSEVVSGLQEPGAQFSISWAERVIQQALAQMEQECRRSGSRVRWLVFYSQVVGPTFEGLEREGQQELAHRLGLRGRGEVSNLVLSGKRMYRRILRAVIAAYCGEEDDVGLELLNLRRELARL